MNLSRALQIIGAIVLLTAIGVVAIQAFPSAVGADYALIVQSGSMEPAIMTGSVVFVEETPPHQVEEGDVITFTDDGGNLITHRVVEKYVGSSSMRFITKGDANDNADSEPVYTSDYVGRVMFSIPLIGYIVAFGQTKLGWVTMVLVPTMLLILSELWSLYRAMESTENKTK